MQQVGQVKYGDVGIAYECQVLRAEQVRSVARMSLRYREWNALRECSAFAVSRQCLFGLSISVQFAFVNACNFNQWQGGIDKRCFTVV